MKILKVFIEIYNKHPDANINFKLIYFDFNEHVCIVRKEWSASLLILMNGEYNEILNSQCTL